MKKIILLAIISSCSTPLHANAEIVQDEVHDRTGADVSWQKERATQDEAVATVQKLLKKPLTVASSVQIALLNNRGLQARFEEIGIAQSDLIEAVTLPNPSVDFDVQFPVASSPANRYGWLIAEDFVRILMIPLKKKISEEQLHVTQLKVSSEVLDLVANVKKSYFAIQADQQLLKRIKIIQETTAAALDLGQNQYKAGNITELSLLQMQAAYSEGRLEIAESETSLQEQRENFNALLGFWGKQTDWEIQGELEQPPIEQLSKAHLESLAIAQRLDLQAAHSDLMMLGTTLGLTKTFRWVPVLDFGVTGERDTDNALNVGPDFRIELPIFNQGQSRISRGQSELRHASAKLEELAISIRADVRKNRDKLASLQSQAAFYHDDLLPVRISIVNQGILEYNAMQFSPYQLFMTKADELRAERGYINTLRDYWTTRAELERVVGGTLNPKKHSLRTKPLGCPEALNQSHE